MKCVDRHGAEVEKRGRVRLDAKRAGEVRLMIAFKLRRAGFTYKAVGQILRVAPAAVHKRLEKVPEEARREAERTSLADLP